MTDASNLSLGAEFPPATREQWLKLVEGALKGVPFDKKLVARTYDGLRIEPAYARKADARALAGHPPAWQLLQRIELPDPAAANTEALHELENGATGLALVFAESPGAHGYGIAPTDANLARVLEGVFLDGATLDLQHSQGSAVDHVAALVKRQGVAPHGCDIRFGIDPIGGALTTGRSDQPWVATSVGLATTAGDLAAKGFKGPCVVADGRPIHNAGGSEGQELAFVLAVAVASLRAFEASGVAPGDARDMIYFRLTADADQFLTMAKFRAARKLWARVQDACGLTPRPGIIAAETAWRMMTKRDPWVNMLRTTIAAFSAGLGGADAVTVLPFTAAIGLPDRFARRIARNTQLILLEESNLAKVADPAAGSGGIEDLTQKLCETAWSLFQETERAGGIWPALEQGLIQRQTADIRAAREKSVASRKDAFTGTSEFPDIHETPVSVLDVAPLRPAAASAAKDLFAPLPCIRLAEPFETFRDASDAMLQKSGARPTIFLANLGPVAAFTARAMFAKNLFEAGGIEAVSNEGFTNYAEMAQAFTASGARLACLCSSDSVYASDAVAAATALAGAHVVLAGRPGELEQQLKAAGVRDFIYAGCDVLAALNRAWRAIG